MNNDPGIKVLVVFELQPADKCSTMTSILRINSVACPENMSSGVVRSVQHCDQSAAACATVCSEERKQKGFPT